MADIKLAGVENVYTQPESDKSTWNRVFGGSGRDVIKLYQGEIIGGAGNDILERMVLPNEDRHVWVSYWDSGTGVTVNLLEDWAIDGFGGRDTLININHIIMCTHFHSTIHSILLHFNPRIQTTTTTANHINQLENETCFSRSK